MATVWYDPATMQVMAVYSGTTESTAWSDQGFIEAEVSESVAVKVGRDYTVTIEDGVVTAARQNVNPVQPFEPPPTAEEIDAREIDAKASPTHDELVRLLRFKGLIGGR